MLFISLFFICFCAVCDFGKAFLCLPYLQCFMGKGCVVFYRLCTCALLLDVHINQPGDKQTNYQTFLKILSDDCWLIDFDDVGMWEGGRARAREMNEAHRCEKLSAARRQKRVLVVRQTVLKWVCSMEICLYSIIKGASSICCQSTYRRQARSSLVCTHSPTHTQNNSVWFERFLLYFVFV